MIADRLSPNLCQLVTSIGVSRHLDKDLRCGSCAAGGFGITVFNGAGILSVFSLGASTGVGVGRRGRGDQ